VKAAAGDGCNKPLADSRTDMHAASWPPRNSKALLLRFDCCLACVWCCSSRDASIAFAMITFPPLILDGILATMPRPDGCWPDLKAARPEVDG
jgi:hypothetical protein